MRRFGNNPRRKVMKEFSKITNKPAGTAKGPKGGTITPFDIHQSPAGAVTTSDGGGPVLTNVEVVVIFWGSYWTSTSPAPAVSADTYYQCFTGIVTGPYMTSMNQYRGVGPGTMLGEFINTASDPPNPYTNDEVVTMITSYLQNNASCPPPLAGHNRFYAVVTPPNIGNTVGAEGEHLNFTYNGVQAFYAWITDDGQGLTQGSSNGVVNTFSHELGEACTDPLGNGITTSGGDGGDEIGDACNNEYAIVQMNGVTCNVQCYWSAADNACIIPLGSLSFLVNKNTFGKDEVQEAIKTSNGVFSTAFWLQLEDFSINSFNSFQVTIPTPTGPFAGVAGITITPTPANPGSPPPLQPIPIYEDPTNFTEIQRIRFSYDVTFSSPLITPFPSSGGQEYTLTATFQTAGVTVPGVNSSDTINFELISGADPYFLNVDPSDAQAVSYLSQDLRVFTMTQGESALPGDASAPVFTNSLTPYDYIQKLIGYLNGDTAYTTPVPSGSPDPLNGLLGQSDYETQLSSVTPLNPAKKQNYNFAIARVRLLSDLQGSAGEAANTRVFFRLWIAPSYDTDFQPYTTYLSNPGYPALPNNPLPSAANLPPDPTGQAIQTTPFFATGKTGANDYNPAVPNNNIQTIQIPTVAGQDSVWAYYGCFLDVYNSANNCTYPGTHHCLVAQIAYDNAPIIYSSGVESNPGNNGQLAQRNLQITSADNPGPAAAHRVPQAFDTRPSAQVLDSTGKILNYPDEMMIDWGNTPVGSTAHIYWPQVASSDVVSLASKIYTTHQLTATDANTVSCPVVKGVTYIPIPSATKAGTNFAGLFTVDLPKGIKKGQEFNILVRRLATRQVENVVIQKEPAVQAQATQPPPTAATSWRYVTGAFQVKIPVETAATLLDPLENTLAIMKARLQAMSTEYRWYPVTLRLIEYISGMVNAIGGNAGSIPPSLNGYPVKGKGNGGRCPTHGHEGDHHHEDGYRGKVSGLIFDRWGDFEGFELDTDECAHTFFSRELGVKLLCERAWQERLLVTVLAECDGCHHRLENIILHEPPVLIED
jgi:hypothetical protein